jgi:hypothetical protein
MKFVIALVLGVILSAPALAYLSANGNDPTLGSYDAETKVAVKSAVATYSDAISKGHALYYSEDELTGLYKVSRYYSGTANAAGAKAYQACIAGRDVATGDVAGFPCVTRGYVDYAKYDATAVIAEGGYLCIGTAASVKGVLIACDSNVTSNFRSLEVKSSGSGSDLKVRVISE